MSNPVFPSKEDLDEWVGYLVDEKENEFNKMMRPFLPLIDEEWKRGVLDVFELTHLNRSLPEDIHAKAASIFYKTVKRHSYVDGNKRSAIIATSVFYLVNDHFLYPPEHIRVMAIRVAKSLGSRQEKTWLKKLEAFFKQKTIKY